MVGKAEEGWDAIGCLISFDQASEATASLASQSVVSMADSACRPSVCCMPGRLPYLSE